MFRACSRVFSRVLVVVFLTGCAAGALADSFTVHIATPPPPPRVEVIPRAPSPGHFWVGGHWKWAGRRHVWVGGRWLESRPNEVWIRDHWAHRGGEWFFHPGHWDKVTPAPGVAAVIVPDEPPALRAEKIPPPPGSEFFWIGGHWRWEGGHHVWEGGRWEPRRVEEVWVSSHWVHEGPRWRYVAGNWHHL